MNIENNNQSCCFGQICTDKTENCQKHCQTYLKIKRMILLSGCYRSINISEKLIPVTEDEVKGFQRLESIKSNIHNFVLNGNNLLITSNQRQTGKTTYSLKLMFQYFLETYPGYDSGAKGYFINIPEWMNNLESSYYRNSDDFRELSNILYNADIVIWDDLIKYPLSTNISAVLGSFIDSRIRNRKANIFNGANAKNINDYLGTTLASSIKLAEHINFDGESINERLQILKNHNKEANNVSSISSYK